MNDTLQQAETNTKNGAASEDPITCIVENGSKHYSGTVKISIGKSQPQTAKLFLSVDKLTIKVEKIQQVDTSSVGGAGKAPIENELRIVQLQRDLQTGSLGLSIKGGAEHKLPIMISHIIKDQPADKTNKLFVGDAILKVNGELILHCTHDEAVDILKNAGDIIILTVKHYKASLPFLSKDTVNGFTSEECQDILDTRDYDLISSNGGCTLIKKWVVMKEIPLTLGYVTRYIRGTDKLRPYAFEVYGADETPATIHCESSDTLLRWLKYISDNISALMQLEMRMYNRYCSAAERIEFMGWIHEKVKPLHAKINVWNAYEPRFFAIKGSEAFFFIKPPMKLEDWTSCISIYKLYESQLKVVKESDVTDERQHCMLFTAVGNTRKYLSVETRHELLKIESCWSSALCSSVRRLGSVKYQVAVGKPRVPAEFRIDWNYGYSLYDPQENECIWKYRYSQLKGSSDDGISSLKLLFRDEKTGGIETREMESGALETILYSMLAFAGSKFSLVDSKMGFTF